MSAYARAQSTIADERAVAVTDKPVVAADRGTARDRARWRSPAATAMPSEIYSASTRRRQAEVPAAHASERRARSSELQLGTTEEVSAKSKDGTEVHGLLTTPPGYVAGDEDPDAAADPRWAQRPGSAQHSAFERQWFAANGYAVLAVNYRGSAGRGAKLLAVDLGRLGALRGGRSAGRCVDQVVKMGVADPEQARRRRLELRRHPHRLHHRQRQRASRRRPAAPAPRSRSPSTAPTSTSSSTTTRSVRRGIRRRGRPTRRSRIRSCTPIAIKTPTLFLGGEKRLQRAGAGRAADVPGAAQPERRHAARDLSRTSSTASRGRAISGIGWSAIWLVR